MDLRNFAYRVAYLMHRFCFVLPLTTTLIIIIIIIIMRNVKVNVIPVKIWANGTISKSLIQNLRNITESTKSRNYKKQPYWSLHTHFGKY
jgi:hypothetical protein